MDSSKRSAGKPIDQRGLDKLNVKLEKALKLHKKGAINKAAELYKEIIRKHPGHADALHLLGVLRYQQGDFVTSIRLIRKAIACVSNVCYYYNNLGNSLMSIGDLKAAIDSFRQAIELDGNYFDGMFNYGMALAVDGKLDRAIAIYKKALQLAPDQHKVKLYLGNALQEAGDYAAAVACYEDLVLLKIDRLEVSFRLFFTKSLACDWRREALRDELLNLLEVALAQHQLIDDIKLFAYTAPFLSFSTSVQKRLNHYAANACLEGKQKLPPFPGAKSLQSGEKLRVAYVSPHFGNHAIGQVTRPIFAVHDRSKYEVYAYSLRDRSNEKAEYNSVIKSAVDHFFEMESHSNLQIAQKINQDRIHILIDLCGYMQHGRPEIFAYQPAPIQVYWLGHGGYLESPFYQYTIGDKVVTPPEADPDHIGATVRLPHSFTCADQMKVSEATISRADFGLPEDAFVYCAFNNVLKIDPEVFSVWIDILRSVDNSVLWISQGWFEQVQQNLLSVVREQGVDPSRVIFAEKLEDKSVHLARHRLADLFLDTFTVNASTTALDALWSGLPVLTKVGNCFLSNIGASLNTSIGMSELICEDKEAYQETAIALATNRDLLDKLTSQLLRNRFTAPLFDSQGFVKNLEQAYEKMWGDYQRESTVTSFDVYAER